MLWNLSYFDLAEMLVVRRRRAARRGEPEPPATADPQAWRAYAETLGDEQAWCYREFADRMDEIGRPTDREVWEAYVAGDLSAPATELIAGDIRDLRRKMK